MLQSLTVSNFTLVKSLEIEFQPGFTVITGESGAGKSVLLQALSMVLGTRACRDQIALGADQCEVIAEFDLSHSSVAVDFLHENQLTDSTEPLRCVVRRTANVAGRSRAWINDKLSTLDALQTLCQALLSVHGQFEHHQLLDTNVQLAWYDDFCTPKVMLEEVKQTFVQWKDTRDEYEREKRTLGLEHHGKELLEYQVDELNNLNLEPNEFEELNRDFKRQSSSQELKATLSESFDHFENQVQPAMAKVLQSITSLHDEDPLLDETKELLTSASIHVDECVSNLRRYYEKLEIDQEHLQRVEARLNLLHDVARKHKVKPTELYEHISTMNQKLATIQRSEARLRELAQQVKRYEMEFRQSAKTLSNHRQQHKVDFCEAVIQTLTELSLPEVKFDIGFTDGLNSRGIDSIEYLVSTSKKYPPMPIGKIASGGELSRIALSILLVVARTSNLPSMFLDEADIGIGGTTADVVGRMLRSVAEKNQVICITHAPQVAALGDSHLFVHKDIATDGIQVTRLAEQDRIDEIARMVGGKSVSDRSRSYARTLLLEATT